MIPLTSLWLPIVLSAVIAFLASSVLHMMLPWHRKDYGRLPNEADVLEALRKAGVGRGEYAFPFPDKPGDMRSPEILEKYRHGPVGSMTVIPSGPPAMGRALFLWFVYCLAIGFFTAYVTRLALDAGAAYRPVFRVASTVGFLGYTGALWQGSIWMGRSWGTTVRSTIDGLVYALLAGGVFGWLWPR
jgi:hypothetical protein